MFRKEVGLVFFRFCATEVLHATLFLLKRYLQYYSRRVVTAYGYYQTLKCSSSPIIRHKTCSKGGWVPENRSDVCIVPPSKGSGLSGLSI